jgi:hypothetical protein
MFFNSSLVLALDLNDFSFTGTAKNTGRPCSLKVLAASETTGPYTVKVEASIYDSHESSDHVFYFTVKYVKASQGFNIFGGGEVGKEQLNIFAPEASEKLGQASKFSVKWLHGDHFHSELCEGLILND